MKVIKGLKQTIQSINRSIYLKKLRGYVAMLESEHSDTPQLNPALRVQMLLDIHRALADGVTLLDMGVSQASMLEGIITKVEKRTYREFEHDKSMLPKIGMSDEALSMFFRNFLHELTTEDARNQTRRIREQGASHDRIF